MKVQGRGSGRRSVPRLSEMEWEIVKPMWEKGPMPARDLYQLVPKERKWAYKTVKTMLSRLVKKGALTYEEVGNTYVYRPMFSRDDMTVSATRSFIERVFDGGLRPFLAHFVDNVSGEELAVLRAELKRLEKGSSRKGK